MQVGHQACLRHTINQAGSGEPIRGMHRKSRSCIVGPTTRLTWMVQRLRYGSRTSSQACLIRLYSYSQFSARSFDSP